MIADIVQEIYAHEKAAQTEVNQAYVAGLWGIANRLAAHGLEAPDPAFQHLSFARLLHMRYHKVILQLSLKYGIRGYPTVLAFSASGRRTYLVPPHEMRIENDEQFARFLKDEIDGLAKQRLSALIKNSDVRWAALNEQYRVEAHTNLTLHRP